MSFGAWIRAERQAAGMKLNELADAIGISAAYWSRIERGMERTPKNELILAACRHLGLPSDLAFIEARRLPPDMEVDLAVAVTLYRDFKATSGQ